REDITRGGSSEDARKKGGRFRFFAAFCLRRGYRRAYFCVQGREESANFGCLEASMKRREFLHRAAYAAGAAWLDPTTAAKQTFPLPAQAGKFSASAPVQPG